MDLKVKKLDNIILQTKGLLGEEKAFPVLLETRFGIHTFFLKFPIDIIILDEQNRVVVLKESLQPNRFFLWNPIYSKVIEAPSGYIKNKNIKIHTKINIL